MKRFYLAISILLIIIATSVFLNYKASLAASEIIQSANNNEASEINEIWEENKIWFNLIIHEELVNPLETSIRKAAYPVNMEESEKIKATIIINAERITESLELKLLNIF